MIPRKFVMLADEKIELMIGRSIDVPKRLKAI